MICSYGIEFINFCPICGHESVGAKGAVLAPFFTARALNLEPVVIHSGEFRDLVGGTSYMPCKSIYCPECMSVSCSARLSIQSLHRYYQGYQDQNFIDMRVKYEPSFACRIMNRTNPDTLRLKGETCSYLHKVQQYYLDVTGGRYPENILDYGGGSGANTPFKETAAVTIVDIDAPTVYPQSTPPLNAPLPDTSKNYDLICLLNVLEHVNYPVETLRSALGHSATACNVLIEVPLERFMHDLVDANVYNSKKIWTEHINCFSPHGLMKLVHSVGLIPFASECLMLETSTLTQNSVEENNLALIVVCKSS